MLFHEKRLANQTNTLHLRLNNVRQIDELLHRELFWTLRHYVLRIEFGRSIATKYLAQADA